MSRQFHEVDDRLRRTSNAGISSCSPDERACAAYFVQGGVPPFMRAWANELAQMIVQVTCHGERRLVDGDATRLVATRANMRDLQFEHPSLAVFRRE